MSEQFKPYTPEEALREAALIKQKMAENEELDYVEAEREVELAEIRKSAKNGELAGKLKNLDLSNKEDVKKIANYFKEWLQEMRDQKIYDAQGDEIFKTNLENGTCENHFAWILGVIADDSINKLTEANLKEKIELYSHGIGNATNSFRMLSSVDSIKDGLASVHGSDKFFTTLGAMSNFLVRAVSNCTPGHFMYLWGEGVEEGKLSEDFVLNHPNYKSIINLSSKLDEFLKTLSDVFLKYLSNAVRNRNFAISGENSIITAEEIISDSELMKTISRRYKGSYLDETYENTVYVQELSEDVKNEVEMFIEKIQKYQKVLDEFNRRLEYAKPQTENKE